LHGIELRNRSDRDAWRLLVEVDALVRAVPASDVAEIAADALVAIDARDNLVVEVEMLPVGDFGKRKSTEVFDGAEALLVHPIAEPVDQFLHDAEAIVHGCRADLHGAAAEQDELSSFAPTADAADTGDGKTDLGVAGDLLHEMQRDRLDRGSAVATVSGFP